MKTPPLNPAARGRRTGDSYGRYIHAGGSTPARMVGSRLGCTLNLPDVPDGETITLAEYRRQGR